MPSLQELLAKKKLHPDIFLGIGFSLYLPLDVHIIRLYHNIYSRPYPNAGKHEGIARLFHGIQHVTRTAIYIPIFANLYRCFDNAEALALNNQDIKLLQIAALLHDSAREDEGEDLWDQESGLFFYEYVTKTLNVSPIKAKLLAEAIANKDADDANYFELQDMAWVKREEKLPKNIYQKLIHDADCLEIIRARDHFDETYLDFYKDIAKYNAQAFQFMAKIITEAKHLIASQGDSRLGLDLEIKRKYEHRFAYREILTFINKNRGHYPLILSFAHNNPPIYKTILMKNDNPSFALEKLNEAHALLSLSLIFTEEPLNNILAKKNINPLVFKPTGLTLDSSIDAHVERLYDDIYSVPYSKESKHDGIARLIHGIQHVTRAAIYIPIFANLYRRFGNAAALALNNEDIKLLQIAALFHDAAREDEGEDLWDQESGLFFYEYVTKTLNVSPIKAKFLAEAIANKDADETNYFELKDMTWVKREEKLPKNIYQKLIHDADCLEIIRARDHFDANYLDFYIDIAKSNDEAFEIMAKLITEARSLIAFQGDSRLRLDFKIKAQYEDRDAYRKIMDFISKHKELYPLIITLSNNNHLIEEKLHEPLVLSFSKEEFTAITQESLTKAMNRGQLFARSVGSPGAFYKYRKKEDEYTAQLEIRKMTRVKGVPTRTNKPNKLEKEGNPNRSVTMLSHGVGVYAGQGFLILNFNVDKVSTASPVDFDTGRGKKSTFKIPEYTREEKEEQLMAVHRKLKMGGTSRLFWHRYPTTHNEIIYRITKADAIYFTQDSTPHNEIMYGKDLPFNPHAPYLQALFLQIEYEKATGKKLPIFEYSGVHNFIKAAPIYTEEEIVEIWVLIVSNLIKEDLATKGYCSESMITLKIKAIDGYIDGNNLIKKQTALDLNYSPELQTKINLALEEERVKLESQYLRKLIEGIKDGGQLCRLLERSLKKLNAEHRECILTAVKDNLSTLIKDEYQLRSLLMLPLDHLTVEQRGLIFRAIEGNLGSLIKDGYQLRNLLLLPLEYLTVEQRGLIFRAIEGNLETLIKNGDQLRALLALPSLEHLTLEQRGLIFRVIEGNLGTLIEDGDQLKGLLGLPLQRLTTEQRELIFRVIEGNLGTLIKDEYQLIFLSTLSLEQLTAKQRGLIFRAIEGNLGTLIKDGYHFRALLALPLELLTAEQRGLIFRAIEGNLGTLIKDGYQLKDLLARPLELLTAEQRGLIFRAIEGNLGTLIKDGYQLKNLLALPLEQLTAEHRELIFRAIEGNLGTLIKDRNQLEFLLRLPLEQLTAEQRELIFRAVADNLRTLIKDRNQLQVLLALSLEQLTAENRELIFRAVAGNLGTLIKDRNQLQALLMLFLEQLTAEQRELIFRAIEGNSGTLIKDGDLRVLLMLPLEYLTVEHRGLIFRAIEGNLGTLIKDGYQLRNLLMLSLEQLTAEHRELIFRAIAGNLGTLIKDRDQLKALLALPLEQLIAEHRELISRAVVSDALLIEDVLLLPAKEDVIVNSDGVKAKTSPLITGRNGLFAANDSALGTPLPQTSVPFESTVEQVEPKLGLRCCSIM